MYWQKGLDEGGLENKKGGEGLFKTRSILVGRHKLCLPVWYDMDDKKALLIVIYSRIPVSLR